jgi:hypothetical protein
MMEDMQLRGLSKKTQEGYLRAVRQLAEHCEKAPDKIDEEELRQYFLYLSILLVLIECEESLPKHLEGYLVWDQVLLRAYDKERLAYIKAGPTTKGEEIAGGTQRWRGRSDLRVRASATISSMSGDHLLVWTAIRGRSTLASSGY